MPQLKKARKKEFLGMKIVIDTCVVLDVFTNRAPFKEDSFNVFKQCIEGKISGYITSNSVSDIYYMLHRYNHSNKKSLEDIKKLLEIVDILDVTKEDIMNATESNIIDFEDAILEECAKRKQINTIVTRNISDFQDSSLRILSPAQIK